MNTTLAQSEQSRQASIDRATAKSVEQAAAGNLPILLRSYVNHDGEARSTWSVTSRTTGGTHYLVDALVDGNGVQTLCECPATGICWHRAHTRAAILAEIDFHDGRRPTTDPWEQPAA
jgi:hypothetical protein